MKPKPRRRRTKPAGAPPACPACGLPFVDHPGLIGTCHALQRSLGLIRLLLALVRHPHPRRRRP